MNTFAAHQAFRLAAGVCLLVATAQGAAQSVSELQRAADRELEITETIERTQLEVGPQARELIEPLTALSLFYEESGEHVLGDITIERLLSVIRANYGLYSLDQAPSIRLLMSHELERENAVAAWDLEKELMRLALRNQDDARSGRIFRDIGDRRVDILRRYDAGDLPTEIELGCYYDDSNEYLRAARRGAQSLQTAPGQRTGNSCAAGRRGVAKRALASEADTFYNAALEVFRQNGLGTTDEYRDLLTSTVFTSFEHESPGFGRRSLLQLMDSYPEGSLARIETLVETADWDLYYSRLFGTRNREAALVAYADAYAQFRERGTDQASIDAVFSPDVPVLLPAFWPSLLVTEAKPTSRGHVDVEFVLDADGKADDIEVLDTTTPEFDRRTTRDLVNAIKRGQFRPILEDGQVMDVVPFSIRYYVND